MIATTSHSSEAKTPINQERLLLILGGLFMLVNYLALAINGNITQISGLLPPFVWMICALVSSRVLNKTVPNRDPLLFPLALIMVGWGITSIQRLEPVFAQRQTFWLILSTLALLIVVSIPRIFRLIRNFRYTLLIGGLIILIATISFGQNPSQVPGAPTLWLNLGGFFFQPSEVLKIVLVAFLASYLAEQYPALRTSSFARDHKTRSLIFSPRIFGPILLMWGICIILLVWQQDLGAAILFFLIFLIMLYIASGYTRILIIGALLVGLVMFMGYQLFGVVERRVDIWLNPWPEADNRAYQIVQSLMAFASGGITGQGIGQGHPNFIPVVHSDFIFSAIAEEWGLVGVVILTIMLVTYLARGLHIASIERSHPFRTLFATGLSLIIGLQSLIIMAGVLKLIPLTGVTLPFFSYGGSSLFVCFIITGLLIRLSAGET